MKGNNKMEIIAEIIYTTLQEIAKKNGLELTENARKIAEFRAKRGIPLDQCPCAKDDKDRGCIFAKCMREIKENGTCHCNCFKLKGEKHD